MDYNNRNKINIKLQFMLINVISKFQAIFSYMCLFRFLRHRKVSRIYQHYIDREYYT